LLFGHFVYLPFFFFPPVLLYWVGMHCGIYKGSYNLLKMFWSVYSPISSLDYSFFQELIFLTPHIF
jgi:hypothetical protein